MTISVEFHRRDLIEVTFTPPLWRRLFRLAEVRERWAHLQGVSLWTWSDTKRVCEAEVLEEIWKQALRNRRAR